MESKDNCGVCGKPLIYGTEEVTRLCAFCDKEFSTLIYCPEGHYVCDSCHRRAALDVLRDVLSTTTLTDPSAILEKVMAHPSVPMHGPEHHAMVPAIIVAAVKIQVTLSPKEPWRKRWREVQKCRAAGVVFTVPVVPV